MQFRLILQFFLALVLTFTLSACVEEPGMNHRSESKMFIGTNVTHIALDATAQGRLLQVVSSDAQWVAHCAADWVQCTRTTSDKLLINVSDNATNAPRTTMLTLIGGNTQRQITIAQSAATGRLASLPSEWPVSQWEQELLVDIDAQGDWTAASAAEWVKVEPNKAARQLRVKVDENPTTIAREATLTVSTADGKATRQLRIQQKAADTYIMPYAVWEEPYTSIHQYEMERHSTLVLLPDGVNSEYTYAYNLQGTLFNRVEYMVPSQHYKEAILYFRGNDPVEGEKLQGLETFLAQRGFEKQGVGLYWNRTLNMEVSLEQPTTEDDGTVHRATLIFSIRPLQTQAFPTLESLVPAGSAFKYDLRISQRPIIEQWESLRDSKIDTKKSTDVYRFFWVEDKGNTTAEHRAYDFTPLGLNGQFIQSFSNINLAVWNFQGDYFLTDEFMELMTREGFVLSNKGSSRQFRFTNEQKGYDAVVLLINSLRTGKLALFINLTQTKPSV